MANHIAGVDHAIVGVRDLEQAKASFERLGFRTTPRGRHLGWGTANYCLMFPADYIELLGIVDANQFTNNLDRFLAAREGLMSLALRTTDAEATRAAWQAAGLAPNEVADLARLLEPDTELRFRNVMLGPEATGGVALFACAHLTPAPMRRPEWLDHPNGARGIGSITVVVDEPGAFVEPMAKVFGSTCLTETDDTLAVHSGQAVVMFATPDDLDMLHPELEATVEVARPSIVALSLLVRDPDETAAFLEQHDVAYRRDAAGAIGIAPEHTHGVLLEFSAAPGA